MPSMKSFRSLIFLSAILFQFFIIIGDRYWFTELWTHYLHYIIVFDLIAVFILIKGKKWKSAMLILILFRINLWQIAPFLIKNPPSNITTEKAELSLLSINFFYENNDFDSFIFLMKELNPDILFVQEAGQGWLKRISQEEYPYQYLTKAKGADGFFIASKIPGEFQEIPLGKEKALEFKNDYGTFISIHPFPSLNKQSAKEGRAYFKDLNKYIENIKNPIVLGDFNAAVWSPKLYKLSKERNLSDAALGFGIKKTWKSKNPLFFIAIDHVLLNPMWKSVDFKTYFVEGSDHLALWLALDKKD